MINIDDVIKEVAKNLNLDKETVSTVCKHVFQETVNLMKSENTSDILFNELFKLKLKRRYKEDKQKQYSK